MSALNIPYVYPDNCHVGLRRNFDYSWFWRKRDVIEDMVLLKDCFDISWCKFFLQVRMGVEWDTDDFQVWFRFGKSCVFYLKGVDVIGILHVLIDNWQVRLLSNLVGDKNNAGAVRSNIIY